MSYPADVATVTVTGTFAPAIPGQVAAGYVDFAPSALLIDSGTGAIVEPGTVSVALDTTGSFSVSLMATDDAHLTPVGWLYLVQERIVGYPVRRYYLPFPTGGPYILGYRAPLLAAPSVVTAVPWSAVGAPNGVASLDGNRQVPLSQLANASGGGAVKIADSGPIVSGNIAPDSSQFVQVGPDVAVSAVAGDWLEMVIEALCANTSPNMIFDAATRVGGNDTHWWSSGGNGSLYAGARPPWYVESGFFLSPGSATYRVVAGDIVTGMVTNRVYARSGGGARTINLNASFPGRIRVKNLGQAGP